MERRDFNYTNDDKAPERIWAWDDKTPTERDKGWSTCDAGTGSTEYVSADLHEAARAVIARLADERDQAINALSKAAEARGRAEGKLEASELPGIVDGWKARAERVEAERDTALAQVEAAYAAGQERMREVAALSVRGMSDLSPIGKDYSRDHAIYEAEANIRAIPITPRPNRDGE